jgi:hypothetical protein
MRCAGCGKSLVVLAGDIGNNVFCHACGTGQSVPASLARAVAATKLQEMTPAAPAEPVTTISPPPVASPISIAPAPRTRHPLATPAAAICIAIASITWIVLAARSQSAPKQVAVAPTTPAAAQPADETWEQEHQKQIIALKSQAEALAIAGKLTEAHARYRELQQLVSGQVITSASLSDLLDKAAGDQDRIYDILLKQHETAAESNAPAGQPSKAGAVAYSGESGRGYANPALTGKESPATQPSATPASPFAVPQTQPAKASSGLTIVKGKVPTAVSGISDEEIGESIQRGVEFLWSNFRNNQIAMGGGGDDLFRRDARHDGLNALCVYALLQASQAIKDERLNIHGDAMKALVDAMKEANFTDGNQITYGRSLRAAALAIFNRQDDRKVLQSDVQWLINAASDGAYTYGNPVRYMVNAPEGPRGLGMREGNPPGGGMNLRQRPAGEGGGPRAATRSMWDNSNSQYGLLGVWSGAEAGVEVPDQYWREVEKHWITCQTRDGEWGYHTDDRGRFSMTCAGIASLFVTHDHLDALSLGTSIGRAPYNPSLTKGLAWLEQGDNCLDALNRGGMSVGYSLYGLERVGLASGMKYFGKHDWYRELAAKIIANQWRNGSWGRQDEGEQAAIETAYTLLFLSRGRHPIMMNKLRFGDLWTNRPRDVANLDRFASRELERPLNWQVVNLQRDWTDWLDAPILYIASHQPPKFSDADVEKLRKYVEAGGLLFTHADNNSEAFNKWAAEFSTKLFPACEMQDLPADHELYSIYFKINQPHQKLRYVTNGARILLIHSPGDMAASWQQRAEKTKRPMFELGTNVFVYAAGMADYRNRLSTLEVPSPSDHPKQSIKMARLEYAGNWNPEPAAWPRFARQFQWETGVGLAIENLQLADLKPDSAPMAHLTGTAAQTPTVAEIAAMRRYVEAGGILFIDPAGGAWQFNDSVERVWMARAFPEAHAIVLPADHPILLAKQDGMADLSRQRVRTYASQKLNRIIPPMKLLKFGKGQVIISSLDITQGLLGTNTCILGYQASYAQDIARNVVLWSAAAR